MKLYKLFICLSCFTSVLSKNGGFKLNISDSFLKFGSSINNFEARIFEGEYVKDIREYPFMVFMHVKMNETHTWVCGGTIISPSYVLTAAHCIGDLPSNEKCLQGKIILFVGSIILINALRVKIKAHYVHPQYQENKCNDDFDIAVLKLDEPLIFTDTISSVILPDPLPLDSFGNENLTCSKTTSYIKTGKICKVLGWGRRSVSDEVLPLDRKLKEAEIPLIDIPQCQNRFPGMCKNSQICSLDPDDKTGICLGDSGGPIICDGVQVGIMAYVVNENCVGPNLPNVYTRVDVYMKFINDIMSGNNASKPSDCSDSLLRLLIYLFCIELNALL